MKRTRKHIEVILDRSLRRHANPSRSEIESAANRVWESLPAEEIVDSSEAVGRYLDPPKFRVWQLAAVAAILIALSAALLWKPQSNELPPLPSIDASADANVDVALMEAVSTHISRTMPAPMEPIMTLIPSPSGGTE